MKTKQKKVHDFIAAARNYCSRKDAPVEFEDNTLKLAVVFGENGYDVSLWCEPETSRYYCKCVIRNVYPDSLRPRVINLLDYLRQKPDDIGGIIGISQVAGDLMWKTYCEAPKTSLDAHFFDELISLGVGSFNQLVEQVRALVARCELEGDDNMNWN